MRFLIGDYLAGTVVGALVALAVRAVVWPGMDMVVGMLLGMAVGIAVHLLAGLLLAPVLGMFETMIPTMLIGMYGGMIFGMRDSMAAGSPVLAGAAAVGALVGGVFVFAIEVYDRALRGTVDAGE